MFVAAVGVYLLLRKDIDGAEMDEVYVEDEPEFGMPPLADDHVTGVPEVQTDLASPESTDGRLAADRRIAAGVACDDLARLGHETARA